MSFREWSAWLRALPWSLKWFVLLVLARPVLDTLYFLKDISPFLSPLYLIGVLTPVAIVASYYARSFPKTRRSALDLAMGGWGWLLFLSALVLLVFYTSADSVEVGLKITTPVFLYFYARHLVRDRRDLIGGLTTFLFSTAVPFAMLLYERLVSPLGALTLTRDYERYGGLYADTISYALYSVGAMLVVCYFFLAQPPYAKYRTHATRLVVVGALFVLALLSMHHAASYGVGGALVVLLLFHSVGSGRSSIVVVVVFAVILGGLLVGDTLEERVAVMFGTDMGVLEGDRQVDQAFHGRMLRWEVYLDYWEDMPVSAKLFGVALSGAGEETLNYMMLGGIHSDYLRITFASGIVGMLLYLAFFAGVLFRALRARWAERFLLFGASAMVLMYSLTILPTLYAPLMYLCLPIFAYASLPRQALREPMAALASGDAALVPEPPEPEPLPAPHASVLRPLPFPPPPPERRAVIATRTAPQRAVRPEAPRPAAPEAPAASRPRPAPSLVPQALIEAALDEVLARGATDWVMAGEVALVVRKRGGPAGAAVRVAALKVIDTALRRGLVVVGDVTEAGFQTWKDGPVEVMNRVARRWPEGFEPGLGDVCWLNLTKAGLLRGLEVERRRAAKPMEAAHAV